MPDVARLMHPYFLITAGGYSNEYDSIRAVLGRTVVCNIRIRFLHGAAARHRDSAGADLDGGDRFGGRRIDRAGRRRDLVHALHRNERGRHGDAGGLRPRAHHHFVDSRRGSTSDRLVHHRNEPRPEAVRATGIALSPSNMAYSVFAVTAVLLTLLLVYSAWKAQRTLRVDI